jgi:cellulose synthase/poly-beta-1,6-N-acetylglucosamine synthase-like glycosyltransferase
VDPRGNVVEKRKLAIPGFFVKTPKTNCSKDAKITIGIPAYNERERIADLLQNLSNQVKGIAVEIIVNASGSTDGTDNKVAEIAHLLEDSVKIRVLAGEKRGGKAAALNNIISRATGNIVVFIDADTIIGSNSVNKITEPFLKDCMIGVVSGNIFSLNDNGDLFSFMSQFQRELHHELCINLKRNRLPPKVNGTFFAVRKNVVKHFPYFIVSDDEYASWQAQSKGFEVVYAPEAVTYTQDPTNFSDYVAKRRRIYCGHLWIKKQLKYKVPTTSVRRLHSLFLKLALKRWRKTPSIIIMLLLEFISRVLALSDTTRGKVPYLYRLESAKFTSN